MRGAITLVAVSVVSAALLAWSWSTGGPRGGGFALALTWLTMTWTAVLGRVVRLRLPAGYYRIRRWEGSGRAYEALGVRVAKAALRRGPMSVFNRELHLPRGRTPEGLRRLDAAMRQAETSHLVAAGPVIAWTGYAALRGWADAVAWSAALNVVVNGYPVMLQRYNRNRLARLLADQET